MHQRFEELVPTSRHRYIIGIIVLGKYFKAFLVDWMRQQRALMTGAGSRIIYRFIVCVSYLLYNWYLSIKHRLAR
jgi:hypothetical protein